METSVLRTISENTNPPDVRQEIATDAYPLLLYGDTTVWNTGICGDFSVAITHDGVTTDFVTFGYVYQGASADRWIDVLPTLNS